MSAARWAVVATASTLLLASCDRAPEAEPGPTIADYGGKWVTPPFPDMFADAGDEMVEDLRAGNFEAIPDLTEEEREEFMAKSDEEILAGFREQMKLFGGLGDFRIALTIDPSGRFLVSIIVNGEETIGLDESVQYELTDREILVRAEDETHVIYLEEDHLKTRNENYGKYPRFLPFYRDDSE